jgi:hypothetical protein
MKYKHLIMFVVFYGYETRCVILREECSSMVFENRVVGREFGSMRERERERERGEVTGGWRELHYEELYYLYAYSLRNIRMTKSRSMIMEGAARGNRIESKIIVRKPKGTRPIWNRWNESSLYFPS